MHTCPTCLQAYRPKRREQVYCNRRCAVKDQIAQGRKGGHPQKRPADAELRRLYESGLSGIDIAKMAGVNPSTIQRALARAGVKFRPNGADTGRKQTGRRGPAHQAWKGNTYTNARGYIRKWVGDHPVADNHGYVLEHRYVYWQAHGPISTNQHIHHINGIKTDNRLENLVALTKQEHAAHHSHQGIQSRTPEQRSADGRKAGLIGSAVRWGKPRPS